MPDYQKMYYAACAAMSTAVDEILRGEIDTAEKTLRDGLSEAEEIYIDTASVIEIPNLSGEKTIFSRRYSDPMDELKDILEGVEPTDLMTGEEVETALREFKRRMKTVKKTPDPRALNTVPKFIAQAKELSESYEIDMDIRSREYNITVDVYLRGGAYPLECTLMLGRLLSMSSSFCPMRWAEVPDGIRLSLSLQTCI